MRSRYQVYVQFATHVLNRFLVEGHSHSSAFVELVVVFLIRFWICPHQVAEKAVVRYVFRLLRSFQHIYVGYFLADASVHAKYFIVDQSGYWELFEHGDKTLE